MDGSERVNLPREKLGEIARRRLALVDDLDCYLGTVANPLAAFHLAVTSHPDGIPEDKTMLMQGQGGGSAGCFGGHVGRILVAPAV